MAVNDTVNQTAKPRFASLDLLVHYQSWYGRSGWVQVTGRQAYEEHLRVAVADPENVVLRWCDDCTTPIATTEVDGRQMCEFCANQYTPCERCGTLNRERNYVSESGYWCDDCCNEYSFWCENCDERYDSRFSDQHLHGNCDCDPPTYAVAVATTDGVLGADQPVLVQIPPGQISEEGIDLIRGLLWNHARDLEREAGDDWTRIPAIRSMPQAVDAIEPTWNTQQGNFTKRLSRHAYNQGKVKIDPEILTEVGNLARAHSTESARKIEFTRNLNLSPEEFANDGSCWWGEEAQSRCALKTNGGFALRSFSGDYDDECSGRAWVLPLKDFRPTFGDPDAYCVFNTYGDLDGFTAARVLGLLTGWRYSKIEFTCHPMYVNSSVGYLLAPEVDRDRLVLELDAHADLYTREHNQSKELTHA